MGELGMVVDDLGELGRGHRQSGRAGHGRGRPRRPAAQPGESVIAGAAGRVMQRCRDTSAAGRERERRRWAELCERRSVGAAEACEATLP